MEKTASQGTACDPRVCAANSTQTGHSSKWLVCGVMGHPSGTQWSAVLPKEMAVLKADVESERQIIQHRVEGI